MNVPASNIQAEQLAQVKVSFEDFMNKKGYSPKAIVVLGLTKNAEHTGIMQAVVGRRDYIERMFKILLKEQPAMFEVLIEVVGSLLMGKVIKNQKQLSLEKKAEVDSQGRLKEKYVN